MNTRNMLSNLSQVALDIGCDRNNQLRNLNGFLRTLSTPDLSRNMANHVACVGRTHPTSDYVGSGKEERWGGLDVYVAGSDSAASAVIFASDVFGVIPLSHFHFKNAHKTIKLQPSTAMMLSSGSALLSK